MLLPLTLAALASPVGAVLGFIRDQGQPRYMTDAEKAADPPWRHWKRLGMVIMCAIVSGAGADDGHLGRLSALIAGALFTAAWTMGHLGGSGLAHSSSRKGLSVAMAYVALTVSGLLLAIGPAGLLIWRDQWTWVPLIVLVAGAKTIWYEIAYRVRPIGSPWPHATAIGACLHGGTVLPAVVFALLASG